MLLQDILKSLANGNSLVLLPEEKQLTAQQAGELLGLSRTSVMLLLDAGDLPYVLAGRHRRIALRDVLAYHKRSAAARRMALDKMARDAYQAGLYDNVPIPEAGRDQ